MQMSYKCVGCSPGIIILIRSILYIQDLITLKVDEQHFNV